MKRALYFGYGSGGHFLRCIDGRSTLDPLEVEPSFPWTGALLDTGLLKNRKVPEPPDGRVHWVCGGRDTFWHGFFWWDRSGDRRPACNSGFYVAGFMPSEREAAFAFALDQWPAVVARQLHPLVLQGPP